MTTILLRTLIMYVLVFALLRLMGKREIGKLSVFDLVISIMIAEIAVIIIEDKEKPIMDAVAPIVLLVAIQIVFAFLAIKNRKLRLWMDGTPSVLIRDGRLNRKEMSRQRYNLDDLMAQLREHEITNVDEVELAVLEANGKLSVIPKEDRLSEETRLNSATHDPSAEQSELPPKFRYELLPLPLILDGQVQDESLERLGKNRFWLKNRLREQGIDQFKQVFFCSVDHKGKLYVDRKK
ncbi:DUF421 domain-containing protein [Cohnella sp. CFH 77786]|uniref:DUF421 domain-containing protein n=1 Tax=Cohnella sp. CFH 77786 TaxID=2662265 RepID=UPI001C60F7B5|nr:DUF421 domain-containing protein [Cohnella sp. CFH 77786]MBW5447897.1 DUF421 domain-containing protein [Cohnella sp. CFH 77786]